MIATYDTMTRNLQLIEQMLRVYPLSGQAVVTLVPVGGVFDWKIGFIRPTGRPRNWEMR